MTVRRKRARSQWGLGHRAAMSLVACAVLAARVHADEAVPAAVGHDQQLIQEGHRWADAGDFCKAWQHYDDAARAQQAPNGALLFALGRAAHKAELWEQAVEALQRFLAISTASDESANGLARKWLAEAEAGAARCRGSADSGEPRPVQPRGETAGAPESPAACGQRCASELAAAEPAPPVQPVHAASTPVESAAGARVAPASAATSGEAERAGSGIPTLSYVAWGGALLAAGGMTAAWIAHTIEVDRWNDASCLQGERTREQNCAEHRESYRTAKSWMIGTGIAAAALGATGAITYWLGSGSEPPRATLDCVPGFGPSASCSARF
jgi:hypothetical protein